MGVAYVERLHTRVCVAWLYAYSLGVRDRGVFWKALCVRFLCFCNEVMAAKRRPSAFRALGVAMV